LGNLRYVGPSCIYIGGRWATPGDKEVAEVYERLSKKAILIDQASKEFKTKVFDEHFPPVIKDFLRNCSCKDTLGKDLSRGGETVVDVDQLVDKVLGYMRSKIGHKKYYYYFFQVFCFFRFIIVFLSACYLFFLRLQG